MSNKIHLIYAAAHAGYDPRTVPLGGAAAVCERLVKEWGGRPEIRLTLIGPGEGSHYKGIEYIKLPGPVPDLVHLSEIKYAEFSYRFEEFVADWVEHIVRADGLRDTVFISNDISEAGDFVRIYKTGIPIITFYHVDVVEYFAKMYLKGFLSPRRLTAIFEPILKWPSRVLVPRILGLVFKKQRDSVLYSKAIVVPSDKMKDVLLRCYPQAQPELIHVIPWGGSPDNISQPDREAETRLLAEKYKIGPNEKVLLTLSRISPEKGIDLLLEALALWQKEVSCPLMHLFICGEAAYMQGERYKRKLEALAGRLNKVKVHFPGYVAGKLKAGFFELADLYVFPSRHDSYGLTLVEAMQAGLPILTSSHHSAPDLVREGCGQVVGWEEESAAPVEILRALKELLADPARLAVMGRRSEEVSRGWSFAEAAEKILTLAQRLV